LCVMCICCCIYSCSVCCFYFLLTKLSSSSFSFFSYDRCHACQASTVKLEILIAPNAKLGRRRTRPVASFLVRNVTQAITKRRRVKRHVSNVYQENMDNQTVLAALRVKLVQHHWIPVVTMRAQLVQPDEHRAKRAAPCARIVEQENLEVLRTPAISVRQDGHSLSKNKTNASSVGQRIHLIFFLRRMYSKEKALTDERDRPPA
jgi:hypothetical protein